MNLAEIASKAARRFSRYGADSKELVQGVWEHLLASNPPDEAHAYMLAKNACRRVIGMQKTSVSMPWKYHFGRPCHPAQAIAQQVARNPVLLDEPIGDSEESRQSSMVCLDNPEQKVALELVLRETRSRCTKVQSLVLDALLHGYSQVEIASELGYSRAAVSLYFIAIKQIVDDIHAGLPAVKVVEPRKNPKKVVPSVCSACGCIISRKRFVEAPVCKDCLNARRRATRVRLPKTEAQKRKAAICKRMRPKTENERKYELAYEAKRLAARRAARLEAST